MPQYSTCYPVFMYKVIATNSISFPTSVFEPFGISTEKIDRICRLIEDLRAHKQIIKVVSATPHLEYPQYLVNIVVEFEPFADQKIQVQMTSFKPPKFSTALQSEIDEIERVGLDWAASKNIYPDGQLKGLAGTFCSALVHFSYAAPFFTKNERQVLRQWIDVLFANDDKRDKIQNDQTISIYIPQFVELPEEVRADNRQWLETIEKFRIKPDRAVPSEREDLNLTHLSPKSLATIDVLSALFPDKRIPDFFVSSLKRYVDSTLDEANYQVTLTWPTESDLGLMKGVSSGSEHAINVGLSIKAPQIDLSELNRDRLVAATASLVEHHNDVDSHAKEQRERLKKLSSILVYIKDNLIYLKPFIDNPSSIQHPQLKYVVDFYNKFDQALDTLGTPREEVTEQEFVGIGLRILPSYNLIDLYHRDGFSLQKSYELVSSKGNGALVSACNFMKKLELEKSSLEPIDPTVQEIDHIIRIAQGWAQQNYWAWAAKRYSEGISEMNASTLMKIMSKIQEETISS